MAALDPAIHVLSIQCRKTWMPGTRPGMAELFAARLPYLVSTGSGFTLSLGGPACMVISVIETRS